MNDEQCADDDGDHDDQSWKNIKEKILLKNKNNLNACLFIPSMSFLFYQ